MSDQGMDVELTKFPQLPKVTDSQSSFQSDIEGENVYDSSSPEASKELLLERFHQLDEIRKNKEAKYAKWICMINENPNLGKEVEQQCGMKVCLEKDRVRYSYQPDITQIKRIKYKLTFVYQKFTHKWYISLHRSFLPEIIKFDKTRLQQGTYNPIGPHTLRMIQHLKKALVLYAKKLEYVYGLINNAKEVYKNIEFEYVSPCLSKIKITLKDDAWPKDLEELHITDALYLAIELNENFYITDLQYEYMHRGVVSLQRNKIFEAKIKEKLNVFTDLPLKEAFYAFMNPNASSSNSSSHIISSN